MVKQYLELLGNKGVDRVTGFAGVIESVSFDLYGCVTLILRPPLDSKGEMNDSAWFDIARVKIGQGKKVIESPNFFVDDIKYRIAEGTKGAADKPILKRGP